MPKRARALTAIEIRRLTRPGIHPVGEVPGLSVRVKPGTLAQSWVLRTVFSGRRREIGLGGLPGVTLAQARQRARDTLDQIRGGTDPVAERREQRKGAEQTFEKVAGAYITEHRAGWKSAKHAAQWTSTLSTYAFPHFGSKHVKDVTKADVLSAVSPIWSTKTETATRVRNRIEIVLQYAMQRGHRPEGVNPAALAGLGLPGARKVTRVLHHAAVEIDGMHGFMQRLRQVDGMGSKALEFAILTAARSGEVRGATWSEIDLDAGLWAIPAERMKAGREHRVPLSPRAVTLLQSLPRIEGVTLLFPGAKGGPLSDMTLSAAMRRMGVEATPHGFRSSFRDWAAERTNIASEVVEMALAHAVGDKTEAAYRRGDLFEKRRELMDLWQRFIDTEPAKGNVRALRGAA